MTAQAIAKIEAPEGGNVVALPMSPADRLAATLERLLLDPNFSKERFDAAFDAFTKIDNLRAKREFDAALAEAQGEYPPINKNRTVDFESKREGSGRTTYDHEDLAEVVEKCGPVLARHGFSWRWETQNEVNQPIVVTNILTHRGGYSTTNQLRGPRDESGNKNGLQGIASTCTYLERYTFKANIGAASRHDDDGRLGGGNPPPEEPQFVSEEQLMDLRDRIEATNSNTESFCKHMGVGKLSELRTKDFDRAVAALKKKADDAKKQQNRTR